MGIRPRYGFLLLVLLITSGLPLRAQQGFYVPQSAQIFFTGDSSSIFSNVIIKGNMGVGRLATVNFLGQRWENDPGARITDESEAGTGINGEGGWVRFLSNLYQQQLFGGYNAATGQGPSFGRFKLDNPLGVQLINSNARSRNAFDFHRGRLYLEEYIWVLGNGNPGILTGYDSSRYFVTGNAVDKGLLLRENIRRTDGLVIFPLGTKDHAYTPAALQHYSDRGDDFFATVFDSVRTQAVSGNTRVIESVNKTWQLGRRYYPNEDSIRLVLQHREEDEGGYFSLMRNQAYVSQFINGNWDTTATPLPGGNGYLTSSSPLLQSHTNERGFGSTFSGSSFFTKLTGQPNRTPETRLWFNAYRIDPDRVRVYWNTNPEINVRSFVVERRLSPETDFAPVGSVPSQAPGGYSFSRLAYETADLNSYTGVSYYRLRIINHDASFWYSDTVAVTGKPGMYSIMIWPNPSTGHFQLTIHKTLPAKSVIIWNAVGQLLRREDVNGRNIIPLHIPIQGTYFVGIMLTTGEIIDTKKVVIAGSQ